MTLMPGPGDPETWGQPTGHPNDPRTDDSWRCEVCDGPLDLDGWDGSCGNCADRQAREQLEKDIIGD